MRMQVFTGKSMECDGHGISTQLVFIFFLLCACSYFALQIEKNKLQRVQPSQGGHHVSLIKSFVTIVGTFL